MSWSPPPRKVSDTQVMVVGGGPAGAVTGLLLAQRGWQVELVDRARFPRNKACGECLNPGGVALLAELGLVESVLATSPAVLEGWDLALPGDGGWQPPARGRFRGGDRALGICRATFDAALLGEARAAGVRVREGVRVVKAHPGGPDKPAAVELVLPGGGRQRRTARVLVGADGLNSRIRSEVGLAGPVADPPKASLTWRIRGTGPSRHQGRLLLGRRSTVGLAPVAGPDATHWNATLVVVEEADRANLLRRGWSIMSAALQGIPGGWRREPRVVAGPWGSGHFHRPVQAARTGRTLLVGDAAGYFDPLTGQGIYRALLSARLAADTIDQGLTGDARMGSDVEGLAPYGPLIFSSLRAGRLLQRAVEGVVSRSPLRQLCLGGLRYLPRATSWLIHLTGDRAGSLLRVPEPVWPLHPSRTIHEDHR